MLGNASLVLETFNTLHLGAAEILTLVFDKCVSDVFLYFIQISAKYNLIYVITKLGLLFVYDLETATAVYRNRISPDPIFLTADAPTVGGFYAVNRRGQVLLATVNEATIVPFVSNQVLLVIILIFLHNFKVLITCNELLHFLILTQSYLSVSAVE